MFRHPVLFVVIGLLFSSLALADPAIRTYPVGRLYSEQMDGVRGTRNALLQNLSIVNEHEADLEVERVELTLLRSGEPLQTQWIGPSELRAIAQGGSALARSGMLEAADFQFHSQQLLGKGVGLSVTPRLTAGTALMLNHRIFAWRGKVDALRISVMFKTGDETRTTSHEIEVIGATPAMPMRFPLRGAWYIGAASSFHTAHRWAVPEEFALDIIRLGAQSRSYSGGGQNLTDFHAYAADVIAAADGEVVSIASDYPESAIVIRRSGETDEVYMQRIIQNQNRLLAQGAGAVVGNHVAIRHAEGMYSSYAHLKTGSVVVAKGERVKAGQTIGKVGNSGNSTEPHLHFQLCDGPEPLNCAGIPMDIAGVRILMADSPRRIQAGDVVFAD